MTSTLRPFLVEMPKLLIISDMAHHRIDGGIVGHGATAREISHLATLFEQVTHVACLHQGSPTQMMLPYASNRVNFVPVSPSGGKSFLAKAAVLLVASRYVAAILRELRRLDPETDVVHVRCPAPISLVAIMLLPLIRSPRKRWVKFAGNWNPSRLDSIAYSFQRWWLRRNFARAKVSMNGTWPDQPRHVTAFVNPSFTRAELAEAQEMGASKTSLSTLRLIFVGQVNKAKGVGRALEIVRRLVDRGLEVRFEIVGDGPQRGSFEDGAKKLEIQDRVTFRGWLSRSDLAPLMAQAHLMILPSEGSEGWPKVLSEGMAFGVVPIASNVGSIPQYLREAAVGVALEARDLNSFVEAIANYVRYPERWQTETARARLAAERFTYEAYLDQVSRLLKLKANSELA